MKKNLAIFTLGFVTPFAIPLTRAFITGMWLALTNKEETLEEMEARVIELGF